MYIPGAPVDLFFSMAFSYNFSYQHKFLKLFPSTHNDFCKVIFVKLLYRMWGIFFSNKDFYGLGGSTFWCSIDLCFKIMKIHRKLHFVVQGSSEYTSSCLPLGNTQLWYNTKLRNILVWSVDLNSDFMTFIIQIFITTTTGKTDLSQRPSAL